jgi:hypothetical protein
LVVEVESGAEEYDAEIEVESCAEECDTEVEVETGVEPKIIGDVDVDDDAEGSSTT